jgi:GNAT superfamily N-acetyltransferase
MAELYESPKQYISLGGQSGTASDAPPSIESIIDSLPADEREEALKYITAPPTGEEVARAMAQKNANGELMDMTLEQYRLFKAHQKSKETDVIGTIGEAASTVFDEISKAAGSVYDKPVDSMKKLTPSVIEAFAQGTRNLYGMAAQSADPTSVFFRMKNALLANGDDEAAEYQQFMEAQAFNLHSMRLMTGQDTLVMDKDVINPEMTQVMSYIADPTLFIPFGGIAAKGATMIGMGEKLAMASARTAAIKRNIMGGVLKWGVGAPIEFMGTAVRNTIDYGLERSAKAFETVSGISAVEAKTTAQMYGWTSATAAMTGATIPVPIVGDIAGAMVGSTTARGVGEAISMFGEQMQKQKNIGRGVLGYAGQALRDTKKSGVVLSKHAQGLLNIIEAVDPFFAYADEITAGAFQGAAIGGGLGYLAGGEEGMAGGIGSGMALGAVGAGAGRLTSDITGNTKMEQIAIQRKLVIEGLKDAGNENHVALEAMAIAAEATGDRRFQAQIDGIIAGLDVVNPDAVIKAFNEKGYTEALTSQGIDPTTGKLREKSRIFPELGDRRTIADVLGILRDNGGNFSGDPAGFEKAITTEARYKKLKPVWERLDDNAKAVLLKQIKENSNPDFIKSLKGRQVNAHFGDLAYAERLAEMINTLNQKNANLVSGKIAETLKAETRSDKKLTRRGQMLKEKLQADGYIDKDGTIRKSRNMDVEETLQTFDASAGWVKRRNSTGQTEIFINLDKFMAKGNRETMPHELFHSVMRDSVFAKDYSDRLIQKLVGTFDPQTGKMLEKAVVDPTQLQKFMEGYINSVHRNQSEEFRKRKIDELKGSIEEYKKRNDPNRVADSTQTPLEHLVEEFGAYYFAKFVMDKPVDFLFRGGEYSGLRAVFETSKESFLDFWKAKISKDNPSVNFDNIEGYALSRGFGKDGKRAKVTALDLLMQDMIRMQSNINKGGRFDISNLSPDARKNFIQTHGLRGQGFETIDKAGNLKKPKLRRYTAEEIRQGKEMFKVLDSLSDADHRGGMRRDGDGNWSGKPNTAQMNALVGTGYLQRAWFDRLTAAYNILDGKGSNVVEFGYLGYSAHIGDGNERVYGAAVPFKNRRAILLDVDFKVRADGTTFANFHTLDLRVIEARGNEVWRDPQVRDLWNGDRTSMEADFYAYLSNASLPSGDINRKPSFRLLDRGDGLGGQRRDALHQMLGFHKGSDLPYINKPIAEIPVGIRHSVTTFSNDGIVAMRTAGRERVDYNHQNAHLDLSRNFMPDELREEKTPSGGKILKHATGYNISKQAGEKFKVFDPEGKMLGAFDTVADAGRAAQKHYNDTFDKSVEGVDAPVPPTEIPPSRVAYLDKNASNELWKSFEGEKKSELISELDRWIISSGKWEQEGVNYSVGERNNINNTKIIERVKRALEENDTNVPENLIHAMEVAVGMGRQRLFEKVLREAKAKLLTEYDQLYPMEIKSALHPRLAQIFQDYPNLTAQGLLKKLVVYGSQGSRMFQEATEIGLVDLLKSKIQKTTTPRFLEDGTRIDMAQGVTQPKLDMTEILDFAKSKEIKVTIEEGARERSGMDTSRFTLGGAKDNYKETAVRINPEYAHGISGHYGKDTIVHFRTTERIDADGNRHLFIEEVQANNTDKRKVSGRLTPDREFIVRRNVRTQKTLYNKAREEGIYVQNSNGEGFETQKTAYIKAGLWNSEKLNSEITLLLKEIFPSQGYDAAMSRQDARKVLQEGLDHVFTMIGTATSFSDFLNRLEAETESVFDKHFKVWKKLRLSDELLNQFNTIKKFEVERQKFYRTEGIQSLIDEGHITNYTLDNPDIMLESIQDNESLIQLHELSLSQKEPTPLPLTAAKDWTLTGLKGIIRQAIRDGLDRITLTHPDDSPTVSHMKGDARKGLYGKLIPEVWGAWLRKYGIEMKQTNKLADATIDTAKGQMAEITNKLHDANKAVLEHFEQVGNMENPTVIQKVSELLAMPVHEVGRDIETVVQKASEGINDVKLKALINEVGILKGGEKYHYEKINELRTEGIRGTSKASDTDAGISAEAIDRGMTFELNDRIKRDFLDGKIETHMMPAEGEQGGRTYTPEQMSGEFIGRWSSEVPDLKKGLKLYYGKIPSGMGMEGLTLRDKKGDVVANIKFERFGDEVAIEKSDVVPKHQGKGYGYLVYSELLERLRSEGVKTVSGMVIDNAERPIKIRKRLIDVENRRIGQKDNTTILDARYDEEGNKEIDVESYLKEKAWYQPSEEDAYSGGRVYDFNSKEFRTKFIGKWAEENPERLKGYDLEFIDRGTKYGTHNVRIRLQDNSTVGQTENVGHITADIDPKTKVASLSSNIGAKYRGNKLSYALYSEMAERLRSMGVTKVDGTIINPEGIPIKVRERIIGNTRVLRADDSIGLPIDYKQGARIIQRRQAESGNTWGGLDVVNELDPKARYMPAEGEEPIRLSGKKKTISTKKVSTNQFETEEGIGRTYNTDSRKWTNGFIGRYAEENPDKVKFLKLSMKNWDGRTDDYGKRSIELKNGKNLVGRIDYEVKKGSGGKWLLSDPTVRVEPKYRGQGYSNLLYSEMAERARFLGAEDFLQRIENEQALPMYAQVKTFGFGESKLIDADRGQYFPPTKENFDKLKKPLIDIQKQDGSYETMEGYEPWVHSWSKIFSDRHYMPAESSLPRRYDLDQAIIDKIKPTFKFPYKELTAKEMLQFIIDNNGHMSPLANELISSLDEQGLGARIGQQTSTKGSRQVGTAGWSWHNYNPSRNRIHMLLERKVEDKRKYTQMSYEELMVEEILHAVTLEKTPEPIKHGSTIEDTLKTVNNFLRNKDKYKEQYREEWKEVAGAKEEWFTIADAYKKVHQQVASGKYLDGTEFTKQERHSIDYRLSNMGEFVIGITQTKEIQRILSDIKVPKSETTLLTKILDAIKSIWNFDDNVMGSLLEHTSDAVEKVIRRDKTQMERAGTGRFPQRAKDYFGGMPESKYMPAEGEKALVQNGFEKSELNKQLLASGHIVLGFDERTLEGKAVVINNPDTMMTGTLETPSGKILAEGEGGLNFVSKFADIWANSKEAKARTTANKLKKAQKENGGVTYLSLTRGSFENALNSHTGAKAGMGILEYFVEQGYISLEEFRNALKDSGRKYGIEFNATRSAKDIHSEIANKFFGVSDSTFERRGDFVKDVITHLAENGESGHKNIDKIASALGANRLGRKIQFAPTGIREAIGLMLSDKRANVDPSHVYAYIEITGNISVEKTENGHKSYPWHIVQRDKNGNKIRPRMLIPDKTNYVTDVFLNKNKQEVPRKGGATKLGSNQVGEAYGYVKPAANIPEGKERLSWMPAEGWRDWQSERTSLGSVVKNAVGYVIMVQGDKFKVYNPYKAMVGIYNDLEQAKRRVQRDEPKR